MSRFLYSILLTFAIVLPASAVDIKLPATASGGFGDWITVKADTPAAIVKWYPLNKNLKVFPTDLLKDTKVAVVSVNRLPDDAPPGATSVTYGLLGYTSDKDGPSDPAVCWVTVGIVTPPGPTPPGPNPPSPTPLPTDPLFMALQAAYQADTDSAKTKHRDDLAELYRQAPVTDTMIKTAQDLLIRLQAARQILMPDTAFVGVRKIIQGELNANLPTSAITLDDSTRAMIKKEFDKVAQYLSLLK